MSVCPSVFVFSLILFHCTYLASSFFLRHNSFKKKSAVWTRSSNQTFAGCVTYCNLKKSLPECLILTLLCFFFLSSIKYSTYIALFFSHFRDVFKVLSVAAQKQKLKLHLPSKRQEKMSHYHSHCLTDLCQVQKQHRNNQPQEIKDIK